MTEIAVPFTPIQDLSVSEGERAPGAAVISEEHPGLSALGCDRRQVEAESRLRRDQPLLHSLLLEPSYDSHCE